MSVWYLGMFVFCNFHMENKYKRRTKSKQTPPTGGWKKRSVGWRSKMWLGIVGPEVQPNPKKQKDKRWHLDHLSFGKSLCYLQREGGEFPPSVDIMDPSEPLREKLGIQSKERWLDILELRKKKMYKLYYCCWWFKLRISSSVSMIVVLMKRSFTK